MKITLKNIVPATISCVVTVVLGFYLYLLFIYPRYYFMPLSAANVPAAEVTEQDLTAWKTYDNEIQFAYPSFLEEDKEHFTLQDDKRALFTAIDNPDDIDCCLYGITANTSDKLILTVHYRPFMKKNVVERDIFSPMSLRNWQPITLDETQGYLYWYHDENRVVEHYAFPLYNGDNIIKLSFVTYKDGEQTILPYKETILSTIEFKQ